MALVLDITEAAPANPAGCLMAWCFRKQDCEMNVLAASHTGTLYKACGIGAVDLWAHCTMARYENAQKSSTRKNWRLLDYYQ